MHEFLFVNDMAAAVVLALENQLPESLYTVGTGEDLTIEGLAQIIPKIVGYKGAILWDGTKPDGNPKKIMNVSKIHDLGCRHQINLEEGIQRTCDWFLGHIENLKERNSKLVIRIVVFVSCFVP